MKLCISTLVCPGWDLRQIIDAAVASSIGGIDFRGLGSEIDITKVPPFLAELDSTLHLFRYHRLALPCFNTSVTLVSPTPERWEMMLDECSRYAHLAGRTGTAFLRIFGGGVPKGMTHEEARIMAQRHLRQVIKICRPNQCIPLVETHDDWSTSPRILELLHGFDPAEAGCAMGCRTPLPSRRIPRLHRRPVETSPEAPARQGTQCGPAAPISRACSAKANCRSASASPPCTTSVTTVGSASRPRNAGTPKPPTPSKASPNSHSSCGNWAHEEARSTKPE